MVSQVTFTKLASRHLISIITYIDQKFGNIAVQEFGRLLSAALASLQNSPEVGSMTQKQHNVRKLVIHKRCILFYRHQLVKDTIQIVDVWDTRRNPSKSKY